jgi:hypothetical protein
LVYSLAAKKKGEAHRFTLIAPDRLSTGSRLLFSLVASGRLGDYTCNSRRAVSATRPRSDVVSTRMRFRSIVSTPNR